MWRRDTQANTSIIAAMAPKNYSEHIQEKERLRVQVGGLVVSCDQSSWSDSEVAKCSSRGGIPEARTAHL